MKIHTFENGQVIVLENIKESYIINKMANEYMGSFENPEDVPYLAARLATETYRAQDSQK